MNASTFTIRIFVACLAIMVAPLASCNGCGHNDIRDEGNGRDTVTVDSDTLDTFIPLTGTDLVPPEEARNIAAAYRAEWRNAPFSQYLLDYSAISALTKAGGAGVRVYHGLRDSEYTIILWPSDSRGNDLSRPAAVYVSAAGNICPKNCDLPVQCDECGSRTITPFTRETDYNKAMQWIQSYKPEVNDGAAHGFTLDMDAVEQMRTTARTSIRVYQGLEDGARCTIMTSTRADGSGLFDATSTYKVSASELCPKNCDLQKLPPDRSQEADAPIGR